MRVKLAAFSPTNLALTLLVIVESSTYSPALSPVIEVQPVADNKSASTAEIKIGLRADAFMKDLLKKLSLPVNKKSNHARFALCSPYSRREIHYPISDILGLDSPHE
jgi:hypothetical protein